jgi:hypothetical protein
MIRKFLPVVLILAFSTIACGFKVSVPVQTVTPGPIASFWCRYAKDPPRIQRHVGLRHSRI